MRSVLLVVFTALALPHGATAAVSTTYDAANRALTVRSDGADPIVVACAGRQVTVNGLPPSASPVPCFINQLEVTGGPGANRIDLSRTPMVNDSATKGITARAHVTAGDGDDAVIGPDGSVLTLLDGGSGSDTVEGRSVDTYVFGPTATPETDTIVEKGEARCDPTFAETDVPSVSWWTVPWDSLDFRTLLADDPLTVSLAAPGGILARHRNRLVLLRSVAAQPFDAVAGGAGGDTISGACMTIGGAGDDVLSGSPTGDLLAGEAGDDVLTGRGGRDTLLGGLGTDRLQGDPGADRLQGGPGDDEVSGGDGGDLYVTTQREGRQRDTLRETGTSGLDTLALRFTQPARVDLAAHVVARAGDATLTLASGRLEGAIGGRGNDVLLGHAGIDHLWGGGGSDLLVGRNGDDVYHIDWAFSLPLGAYTSTEFWIGPFDKHSVDGWSPFSEPQSRVLRIVERAGGGRDTVDVAGPGANEHPGGRVRVDLSGRGQLVRVGRTTAVAGTRTTAANLENVHGTESRDVIVGNAAANYLDGGWDQDDVDGRGGVDTCTFSRNEKDRLRGCERIRRLR